MQRHLLFQAPSTLDNWHMEMVRAVGTAKALGFTNFEMDVTARDVAKRIEAPKAEGHFFTISFGESAAIEGDEWKKAGQGDAKNYKLVPEFLVQVWATRVESV